jgi:hypothetical protein
MQHLQHVDISTTHTDVTLRPAAETLEVETPPGLGEEPVIAGAPFLIRTLIDNVSNRSAFQAEETAPCRIIGWHSSACNRSDPNSTMIIINFLCWMKSALKRVSAWRQNLDPEVLRSRQIIQLWNCYFGT